MTLPAGWTAVAAMLRWDGSGAPGHEEAVVDQFGGAAGPSAWAFAGATKSSLAALVTDLISATYRDHGDTCPMRPEVNTAIRIDGSPARFLAWNCGILINAVVTVRDGTEYVFSMRDVGVHAATDPGDRAVFDALLGAVRLPGS